jgi:hypothetical protein
MVSVGKIAHFRDGGLRCLGSYRTIRIAFGPIYISLGWRVALPPPPQQSTEQ